MRLTPQYLQSRGNVLRAILFFILPLLLAMLACSLPVTGEVGAPQQATGIALGIQQTFIALTQTALQAAPATAVPVQPPVAETPQSVQPSETPMLPPIVDTPTALPPLEATATVPQPLVPDKIAVNEWSMKFWSILPDGCRTSGIPCWKVEDDFDKHLGNEMVLISKKPVLIDPNWGNPYLVFFYECRLRRGAELDIQAGTKWSTMLVLSGINSGGSFVRQEINLRDFKGKEIIIRFTAEGKPQTGWNIYGSHWYITEIFIYPNYQP